MKNLGIKDSLGFSMLPVVILFNKGASFPVPRLAVGTGKEEKLQETLGKPWVFLSVS